MTRPDDTTTPRPIEPRAQDRRVPSPRATVAPADPPGPAAPVRTPNISAPIEGMPFEVALGELEAVVRRLESGGVALEDSLGLWERGEALKRHCEGVLARADARVQRIVAGEGGTVALAPFDGTGAP